MLSQATSLYNLAALSFGLSVLYLLVSVILKKPLLINGFWSLLGLASFFWFEGSGREQFLFTYVLLILAQFLFLLESIFGKSRKNFRKACFWEQ